MHPPIIDIHHSLHQISDRLVTIDRQLNRYRVVIASIETELRETVSLAAEVAACQLEVIEELRNVPPQERNYQKSEESLSEKLNQVREDYLVNYRTLLKERESVMENGHQVALTPAKREELAERFVQKIDEQLSTYRKEVTVESSTDLKLLQSHLEEALATRQERYNQLNEKKDELAFKTLEEQEVLDPEYKQLLEKKNALFREGLKVQDIYLASQVGDADLVRQKIGLKADTNRLNEDGFAPLHYAAYHNRVEVVNELLKANANPCVKDKRGYQPIHWAAQQGNYNVVRAILSSKPRILFWEKDLVNVEGEYKRTPLHMAAWNGRVNCARILLTNGAAVNALSGGVTPLHEAVQKADIEMVRVLVKAEQLDVSIESDKGFSPVYCAVGLGLENIVPLLIHHLSFRNPQDPKNRNHIDQLIELARKNNHLGIFNILKSFKIHKEVKRLQKEQQAKLENLLAQKEKELKKLSTPPEEAKATLEKTKNELQMEFDEQISIYHENLHQQLEQKASKV